MNVLHTNHHDKGDTGEYFFFDENDFDAFVGVSDWNRKTFKITQKGLHTWTGNIFVWKATSDHAAHGRRASGRTTKQWATGDTLEFCKQGKFK